MSYNSTKPWKTPWKWKDTSLRTADPSQGITDDTLVEWRKMVAGQVYKPADPYIHSQRLKTMAIVRKINESSMDEDPDAKRRMIAELVGADPEQMFLIWATPFWLQFVG